MLTIKGLKKGRYAIKSYHNHPERISRNPRVLQVYISDRIGEHRLVKDGAHLSSGSDLFNKEPASVEYAIEADGINPVVITFKSKSKEVKAVLNGFILSMLY